MATNEQRIAYVKEKLRSDFERWLENGLDLILYPLKNKSRITYPQGITFGASYDVDDVKAEAVVLDSEFREVYEPKQEHEHNALSCDECDEMFEAGAELERNNPELHAGKASLKPLDIDWLTTIFTQYKFKELKPAEQAKVIADHFAAPQPKHFTLQEADRALALLISQYSGDPGLQEALRGVHFVYFADAINKVWGEDNAAPEPKRERITVTPEQGQAIFQKFLPYIPREGYNLGKQMSEAIEHVLNEEQSA